MNKLQFLSLLIPSVGSFVLVILAWMYSSQRLNELEQVVDTLSRDLREFYRILGKLDGRVDEIVRR